MKYELNLVVTENCNLSCKYCYMHKRNTFMHIDNIKNFLINQKPILDKYYKIDEYNITYFGGEPLLNWNFIKECNDFLKQSNINLGHSVIISNGFLLTQDKIDYIKKNNISFSWSFDGLGNIYNRVDNNNKSTYEEYKEKYNLIKQLNNGFCKIMIAPNVVSFMPDMLDDFLLHFDGLYGLDFTLVRDDIWSDNDVNEFQKYCKILADKWIENISRGIPLNNSFFTLALKDALVYSKYNYKRNFSCFAGFSGGAMLPNGNIYPCARYASEYEKPIIQDNIFIKENFDYFQEPKLDPNHIIECMNCNLYKICNAGCKYSQCKNNFKPIKNVCKLYKIIYKEALRIHDTLKNNELWINSIKI